MRNKVSIFLSLFCIKRNLFRTFSLLFLLFNINTTQSQNKERYDSLSNLFYSSELPDDTLKVKLMYELSVEASRIGVQEHNGEKFRVLETRTICIYAFALSVNLNYKHGIDLFYNVLSSIFNQKTYLPILGFNDFEDGVSAKKFKELHLFRNKKHFGSLDSYIYSIEVAESYNVVEQNYKLVYWIGLIYFDWCNYSNAIKHFKTAAKSNGIRHDSATLSDVYQCIGASYFYKGSYDSSIVFYNKSLEIRNKNVSQLRTGICLTNLGEVYYRESDF
ncbi:MAG: tetratricopeptide repeat protein, partial [Bacteroidales bacterium]